MPQLSDVIAYQAAVDDLSTLALAELIAFWRNIVDEDPAATAGLVREFVPDLVDTYNPMSAEIAASFYEETRVAANVPEPHTVILAPTPNADTLQNRLSWAVAPLFRTKNAVDHGLIHAGERAPDPDLALSRLTSATQLDVAAGARDTIDLNVSEDRGRPKFARHASANACAFCALMAARGSVYRTAESAGRDYHSHCHCVAYPVFPGESDDAAPYVATWDRAYVDAVKSAKKAGIKPDLKGVLPFMRKSLGAA